MGSCKLCENDDRKVVYIGEMSRTLYKRVGQHYRDFQRTNRPGNRSVDSEREESVMSWIVNHLKDKHENVNTDDPDSLIDFSVISSHSDPFTKQSVEAVRNQDALDKGELKLGRKTVEIFSLNRKGEFFAAKERWDSRRGV